MYDDFLARILEPDIFLPSQFYGSAGLSRKLEGEKRLMIAILKDAVECLEKYRGVAQQRGREAIMKTPLNGSRITIPIGYFPSPISAICWDLIPQYLRERATQARKQIRQAAPDQRVFSFAAMGEAASSSIFFWFLRTLSSSLMTWPRGVVVADDFDCSLKARRSLVHLRPGAVNDRPMIVITIAEPVEFSVHHDQADSAVGPKAARGFARLNTRRRRRANRLIFPASRRNKSKLAVRWAPTPAARSKAFREPRKSPVWVYKRPRSRSKPGSSGCSCRDFS